MVCQRYQPNPFYDRSEAIYASNRKEPVGKSYVRGHQLPAHTQDEEFRFGCTTAAARAASAQCGKDVIFPIGAEPDDAESHMRYVMSHQAFAPGERVNRRYAWPSKVVDDNNFAFGLAQSRNRDGINNIFWGEGESDGATGTTRFATKRGEDWRQAVHQPIGGKCGRKNVNFDIACGISTSSKCTAGEVIRGSYSMEEQMPDKDLGCCVREGRRNVTSRTDPFGKPSGVPNQRPRSASVGSFGFQPPSRPMRQQNKIGLVVTPDLCGLKGLDADEFAKLRDKEEVLSILNDIGYKVPIFEFDTAWDECLGKWSSGCGRISLDIILNALVGRNCKLT